MGEKERYRKISIRLPESSPVWSYPEGERSAKIREWLEVGSTMLGVVNFLYELDKRLASIEAKIEMIVGQKGAIEVASTANQLQEAGTVKADSPEVLENLLGVLEYF